MILNIKIVGYLIGVGWDEGAFGGGEQLSVNV